MEVLFETHPALHWKSVEVDVLQLRASIDPDPVLEGDSDVDGYGASIYGTVLRDGGCFRMWYQATPRDWGEQNMSLVAYAESDDGREWRKPALDLVEYGSGPNNICDLGVHSPSIFIDPDAAPSHRYRATGCVNPDVSGCHPSAERQGYYTFHSADGLHWEIDSTTPQWDSVDVINTIYHPVRRRAIVSMKFNPVLRGYMQRVIHTAEMKDGRWSDPLPALIPDEYDQLCAVERGYLGGDYYGMGMLPAGQGTVSLLWQFRHGPPIPPPPASRLHGVVDISLAYQAAPGACWQHQSGRPDFVSCSEHPWTKGGIYSATCPIEVGDEHWLYICGNPLQHGYSLNVKGETNEEMLAERHAEEGKSRIGIARFPKWRVFGFRAETSGAICLRPRVPDGPWDMFLNYACGPGGRIDATLWDRDGKENFGRAAPLEGDHTAAPLVWDEPARKRIAAGGEVSVQLYMENASVYAYEILETG